MFAFDGIRKKILRTLEKLMNKKDIVRMTHQGLAEMLATYRETVSEILRNVKSEGVVRGQSYGRIDLDRIRLREELPL